MTEEHLFGREEADAAARFLVELLGPVCTRIEVAGSIRRGKKNVHDVDLVAIPLTPDVVLEVLEKKITEIGTLFKKGKKLIQGEVHGIPFDIYLATDDTFETIRLIRTGSKEHNVVLCKQAIAMGYRLKASGEGLIDSKGKVIENTEEGILIRLRGRYIEPVERN